MSTDWCGTTKRSEEKEFLIDGSKKETVQAVSFFIWLKKSLLRSSKVKLNQLIFLQQDSLKKQIVYCKNNIEKMKNIHYNVNI